MTDFDLLQQRLNLANALKERPDAFARRTKIAAALQKPPGLINADDENLYDVDSTMRALDGRPVLLKTIRDNSAFAKLAHDDFERLANIEHLATLKQERLRREREANRPWFMHGALDEAWANIRKIPKAAWAGKNDKEVEDLRYTLQELEKAGTLTEEGRARIEADIKIHENQRDAAFEEIADINRSIADNSPEDLNIWQKMGRGAVTSLPQMAAAAGITMVSRNPTLGALAMGYGVKETSTAEARIAGLDYDAAQRKGMIDGAAEAAFEILPLGKMMGLYGRGAAQEGRATLKELGKTVASEVAGENATQLIQDANNLWHGLDPVWQKAIAEHGLFSPESLKIQGERQLIASGAAALTSGTLSAPALIANMRRSQEQDITNLTAMTDAARASKLNQRAPDVFRGWTEQIEENADIQHYYVDGNALHQSGLVAALEEALPDRVGEIRQALATGGTVQIPAADILTKIAPDKRLEDAITPHLRTADGLSLHELETTGQAELEGAITENAARAERAAAQQTEADAIRDDFAAQLTATGRMTADASTANAVLPAAFYQNIAQRLGISVSEAYEKYKLKVVGEPLVGLNQAMPDVAALISGAKEKIRNFVQGWRNKQGGKPFVDYLEVNEEAVQEAEQHGLDIAGYQHVISNEAVNHIISRHSDQKVETTRAQIALTDADLETIADVVSTPDRRVYGMKTKDGLDIIASIKRMPDGTLSLVEEVRTGRRKLAVKTLRKHVAATDFNRITQVLLSNARSDGNHANIHIVDIDRNHTPAANNGQDILNQDPAPSGDFSAQTTEQQRQFAETAQQYGGEEAYAAAKADGETNLTYRQWVQVRTPAFKEWFGDWENDPEAASKVIDPQTGEPLVVYHATRGERFEVFDRGKLGGNTYANASDLSFALTAGIGHWFNTQDLSKTSAYAGGRSEAVFLNIREPLEPYSLEELADRLSGYEVLDEETGEAKTIDEMTPEEVRDLGEEAFADLTNEDYDGVVLRDEEFGGQSFVAFDSNQIKSATDNSGAFDANNDSILHQNADAPRGAFDPSTNTIALLEKADLSTFIHELGHFYFETLTRIANELRARDSAAGGGTLTDGEIQILKDVDTLIGKAGHTLDDWNQMTLEERRYHHETVARQFEAYLMEGKAPSVELQGIFSRLRSWLFAVYKKLTALNVKLDDDVRQVFDRMLASDEAIQIAEQNRSMMPLFSTPEAVGMTAEQFADYQRQFQGASDAALDEMSLRMLGDAKAIARLKHKALKAKDKEATILRGETEIEARRAIMAQPVYRVWQMLTGKMNADTTIASNKRPWSDAVVPEHDDLFTAIAKLGGINRSDIESTWGFDPADKISPVKPGFFVLRREGGQSLDGMRQALVQYGYLTESDSLNDFYELFEAQRRGDTQYSNRHIPDPGVGKTGEHAHLHDLPSFRLDYASLAEMGYDDAQIATLGRKVKKKGGIHPDLLAELVMDADGNPVYDSGDALVQALLAAPEPKTAVRELTDRIMLERHGELATPEAIGEAADMAAHNDLRLRVLATEYNALAQASGGARLVQSAARQLAAQAIGQKRIRDLSPAQYTRMETRAAKAALAAMKKGDIATAAAEKRNQVLQASLARAAYEAKVETKKHALYLRRMNKLDPKTVAIEEREQIEALLERYNLRDQSGKALDRRQSLAEWVQAQREQGIEPDIAPEMLDELKRQPWQTLTVDELRGLVDTVRQIEHRGRTKNELLTARKKEDYNTAIENMVASIDAHARVSGIENRTPTTKAGKIKAAASRFFAAHLKTAMLARRLDGDTDGGALWEYLIRPANAAADRETTMRAEATAKLTEILAPRIRDRAANRKKSYTIAGKTRSFTHNDIFVMALNRGNEGNLQRLLGGENWEETDLAPLFAELTAADWQAVQAIWDYFETFRPAIAAKERRVNGVEPQWVAPTPFTVRSADGQIVEMRGGYYPIRYDTQASERAAEDDAASAVQAQMRGVHSAATTRRGHTKSRVQEVHNRPLVYNFAGIYSGFSDVIHDLAWHEYLIDANKLLRSTRLQNAVKDHYGTDVLRQFKTWIQDIAVGDNETLAAGEDALRTVRRYASMAGLAFNVVSALKQPLGILQSVARVGGQDVLAVTAQFIRNPVAMTREAQGVSPFMQNRARTRFRELNELRNALEQQGAIRQTMSRYGYALIMAVQQQVDVITWHAQLNKSLRAGVDIQDAVAHADQAVIDSQGSGMTKDLAAIERGGEWRKLFTVYYGFMNTVLNLEVNALTSKRSLGYKAGTVLMLSVAMPIIDAALSDLLKPGDSDDWDEDHWQASVGKAVANSLTGHFFALRELQFGGRSYSGPVGTRSIADAYKLGAQAWQGELDAGFRRALINTAGSWYGLPSAQLNRSWDGFEALDDGKTDNPLALIFGYQEKK
ncbi:PBECR3 domain-containing polyvalent protein [Cardiobacterium hominis]